MRFATLFLFTILTGLACKKAGDDAPIIILESTFEGTEPFKGWQNDQHCCDYSLTQSHDKFTHGSGSLRLEVRDTDPETSSSIRSELVQNSDPVGTERWYGFNMFLENWLDDNAGEHVFQWHPDNTTGTATASLWTSGGRFVFERNISGGSAGSEYIDLGPIVTDRWMPWVIHVKWASDKTGFMQVWKDGQLVINKTNIITSPSEGTYFKLGINKFGWGTQATSSTERILYFDDVKIGGSKARYEDVRPGS